MSNKVIRIGNYLNDGTFDSVEQMLDDAKDRANELGITKALVLLWDENEKDVSLQIRWHQAGLNRREQLHILSMAKEDIILDYFLDHSHE